MFGIGGVAGILAGGVGGGVIGRGAAQLHAMGGRLASVGEGAERAALLQQMGAIQRRMAIGGKVLILLQAIALAMMAIGHYV